MLPEIAIVTNPGAPSRRGETAFIEPVLAEFRPIAHITDPGTMDGGDVLRAGLHFFVGLSGRTNRAGAGQLGSIVEEHGYTWEARARIEALGLQVVELDVSGGRWTVA